MADILRKINWLFEDGVMAAMVLPSRNVRFLVWLCFVLGFVFVLFWFYLLLVLFLGER